MRIECCVTVRRLYEKVQMMDQAVSAYTEFVRETQGMPTCDNKPDLAHAFKFLTAQHIKNNNLDLAYQYAQKCLTFEEVRFSTQICLTKNVRRVKSFLHCNYNIEKCNSNQMSIIN